MFSTDQFSFSQIPTHVSIVQLSITVYRNTGNVFYFLYVGALSPSLSFLNVRALIKPKVVIFVCVGVMYTQVNMMFVMLL